MLSKLSERMIKWNFLAITKSFSFRVENCLIANVALMDFDKGVNFKWEVFFDQSEFYYVNIKLDLTFFLAIRSIMILVINLRLKLQTLRVFFQ